MLDDLIYKTINAPVNVNAPQPPSPNPGKGGDLDKRTRKDEQCPHPQKIFSFQCLCLSLPTSEGIS